MSERNIELKRLIVCLIVCAWAVLAQGGTFAEYQTIYKAPVDSITLAPGVVFEKHRILTPEGWIDAQVLRSSTNAAETLVPIYPNELYRRTVLSKLFDENEQRLVAAINSDFSDYNSYAALGQMVKQGEVIQTSNDAKDMAHVWISQNGTVEMGYNPVMNHIATIGKETFKINYVNKEYYAKDRILLFDRKYSKESPAATDLAVLIRDGAVAAVKQKDGVFSLEEGDIVLHCTGKDAKRLKNAAVVGAKFQLNLDPKLKNLYTSFSGGSIIVKDGKSADFTHNILGHHPRTAMGVTKDGGTVLLVTVSGRSISYRGMRQSELADFMIQLGAYQAINLDGGGSTEMVYRDPYTNNKIIPGYLSDGGERRLYNGVGILYDAKETGKLGGIRFVSKDVTALKGIPVELKLQAYDTAYLPYSLEDDSTIQYEVKGLKGHFTDKHFVPESAGSGTIIATIGDKRAYMNIEVGTQPTRLIVSQNEMQFHFALLTETGAEVRLPSGQVSAYVSEGFGTYDPATGTILPEKDGSVGYVTFTYYINDTDILSESFALTNGKQRDLLYDFEAGKAKLKVLPWNLEATYVETPYDEPDNKVGMLSYRLFYNETKKTSQGGGSKQISKTRAAYIDLGEIEIPDSAESLSLRVFGSGSDNAWMRIMLKSEDKKDIYLDVARNVNWEGWKTVEVPLPNMQGKRYLQRIYVVEVDENINPVGYILVDQVEALTPLKYEGFMPLSFRMEKKVEEYRIQGQAGVVVSYAKVQDLDDELIRSLPKDEEENPSKEDVQAEIDKLDAAHNALIAEQFTFLNVNNQEGLIRTDSGAWIEILEATKMPKKPILIKFTGARVFKDNLEWELLYERIKYSGKCAVLVFDAQPGAGDFEALDDDTKGTNQNPDTKLKSVVIKKNGVTIIELSADEELEVNAKCEFLIRKKK